MHNKNDVLSIPKKTFFFANGMAFLSGIESKFSFEKKVGEGNPPTNVVNYECKSEKRFKVHHVFRVSCYAGILILLVAVKAYLRFCRYKPYCLNMLKQQKCYLKNF